MKFVVTIDTEADNQWAGSSSFSLNNLEGLHRFQRFSQERGVLPTYLLTHEILDHPAMRTLVLAHREKKAEVGSHLHPWSTPPMEEVDTTIQRFPLELSESVLQAKLQSLTRGISSLLGEQPVSFRAGRWGFSQEVAHALDLLGYRVDCSVTPYLDWGRLIRDAKSHTKLPDFSTTGPLPYRIPGTSVTEVPMTVIPTGPLPRALVRTMLKTKITSSVARRASRLRWCRIFPDTTVEDLKKVFWAVEAEKLPILMFMMHSSELSPGTSPYFTDQASIEYVYQRLGDFFSFLHSKGAVPSRLFDATRDLSV